MRIENETEQHSRDSFTAKLFAEIRAFCDRTGMSPSKLGKKALNDSKVLPKLLAGDVSITLPNADRLRTFMKNYRVPK